MNLKKIKDSNKLVLDPTDTLENNISILEAICPDIAITKLREDEVYLPRPLTQDEARAYHDYTGHRIPFAALNKEGWYSISDSVQSGDLLWELNSLLAEEFIAWLQYFMAAPYLYGKERPSIQKFFEETAKDELYDHAAKLMNRIDELNSTPLISSPDSWNTVTQQRFEAAMHDVNNNLLVNIRAEEAAIAHYKKVIALAESVKDYVTAEMLKEILADEEQHLSDLENFNND